MGDHVQLQIDRIKGPGKDRRMGFDLKPIELEGKDSFGKPLVGLTAIKVEGSEDESAVESIDRKNRELRAWAAAVVGCMEFPHGNNDYQEMNTNTINNVATLLSQIIEDSTDVTNPNHEDAKDFCDRFLGEMLPITSDNLKSLTFSRIRNRLTELFYKEKKPPVVITSDGQYTIEFKPRSDQSGAKKQAQRVFHLKKN